MLQNDSLSPKIEKKVVYEFEQQRVFWRPGYVNGKPVNVGIEMTLAFKKSPFGSDVRFITPFLPKENPYKSLPLDAINRADEAFSRGVGFAKKHAYDKALAEFTKCLAIDDLNLDAYYFRATINFELGNRKAACDDWKTLAGLGQVTAGKYLARYGTN